MSKIPQHCRCFEGKCTVRKAHERGKAPVPHAPWAQDHLLVKQGRPRKGHCMHHNHLHAWYHLQLSAPPTLLQNSKLSYILPTGQRNQMSTTKQLQCKCPAIAVSRGCGIDHEQSCNTKTSKHPCHQQQRHAPKRHTRMLEAPACHCTPSQPHAMPA
jgi:hypothetical protein